MRPLEGSAGFYEMIQTNTTSSKYNTYQFNQGYNTMNFYADQVGRHTLYFVVNNQPSNVVVVDVFAQDQKVPITPSSNNETFGFVEGRVYDQRNGVGVASAEMTVDYNPNENNDRHHWQLPVKGTARTAPHRGAVIKLRRYTNYGHGIPEPNYQTGSESSG